MSREVKTYINALIEPMRPDQAGLTTPKARPPIGAGSGVGRVNKHPNQGNAGIAWPLTEPDYTTRTWHAGAYVVNTTDGLFTLVFDLPAIINLEDGDGQAGSLILDAP